MNTLRPGHVEAGHILGKTGCYAASSCAVATAAPHRREGRPASWPTLGCSPPAHKVPKDERPSSECHRPRQPDDKPPTVSAWAVALPLSRRLRSHVGPPSDPGTLRHLYSTRRGPIRCAPTSGAEHDTSLLVLPRKVGLPYVVSPSAILPSLSCADCASQVYFHR